MFLSADEAAAVLRCNADTVRRLAASGTIPGRKLGRRWLFDPDQLRAYVRGAMSDPTVYAWDRERGDYVSDAGVRCSAPRVVGLDDYAILRAEVERQRQLIEDIDASGIRGYLAGWRAAKQERK